MNPSPYLATAPCIPPNLSCRKPNIFDNMMAIMEKYATNLEGQVAERTHLLMEEKKKTDRLLYSMLPRCIKSQAMILARPLRTCT